MPIVVDPQVLSLFEENIDHQDKQYLKKTYESLFIEFK